MKELYGYTVDKLRSVSGCRIDVVENDTDLYYDMAFSLYEEIETNNAEGKNTVCIMPVGPVFQYRRLISMLKRKPLDLSGLYLFFMDEYLTEDGEWIARESPLSFRGFIDRELIHPMPSNLGFDINNIFFPDPRDPGQYDRKIEELGGIDLCHAGVGIVGHLAFNEPIPETEISADEFAKLPTRIVSLTRETITINSNTALRGAFDEIPEKAITVGMCQILSAGKLRIYFNRPWQNAVCRKALVLPPSPEFPVTIARNHPDICYIMTEQVASLPDFALR